MVVPARHGNQFLGFIKGYKYGLRLHRLAESMCRKYSLPMHAVYQITFSILIVMWKMRNIDDAQPKFSSCYLKVGHKVIIVPQDDKPNFQKLQLSWVPSRQSLTQCSIKYINFQKNPQLLSIHYI
jgi:hypothetical protein